MNTKTDGISSALVAVAWIAPSNYEWPSHFISLTKIRNGEHLVRLSDAEAIIAEKDADIRRLKAMLPAIPRRERECKTLEDWKARALYFESEYASCSHGFNTCASRQAERIKELEAGPTIVAIREMIEAECVKSNAEYFAQMEKQSATLKLARKAITNELQPCGCANGCSFCAGKVSLEQALAAIDAAMQEDKP